MTDLQLALAEFVRQRIGVGLLPVVVTSVDEDRYLFDGVDGDDNKYLDIRMNATSGQSGVLQVPAVGSSVLVTDLGNQAQEWVMVTAGDPAMIMLISGLANPEPAVKGETLNETLAELCSQLRQLNEQLAQFARTNQAASVGVLTPLAPAYSALNAALLGIQNGLQQVQNRLPNHLSQNVTLS